MVHPGGVGAKSPPKRKISRKRSRRFGRSSQGFLEFIKIRGLPKGSFKNYLGHHFNVYTTTKQRTTIQRRYKTISS